MRSETTPAALLRTTGGARVAGRLADRSRYGTAGCCDCPSSRTHKTGYTYPSSLMADKITTARRSTLGERVGRLSSEDVIRLDRVIAVFLGLAGS